MSPQPIQDHPGGYALPAVKQVRVPAQGQARNTLGNPGHVVVIGRDRAPRAKSGRAWDIGPASHSAPPAVSVTVSQPATAAVIMLCPEAFARGHLGRFVAELLAAAVVAAAVWLAAWAALGHWRTAAAALLILAVTMLLLANIRDLFVKR